MIIRRLDRYTRKQNLAHSLTLHPKIPAFYGNTINILHFYSNFCHKISKCLTNLNTYTVFFLIDRVGQRLDHSKIPLCCSSWEAIKPLWKGSWGFPEYVLPSKSKFPWLQYGENDRWQQPPKLNLSCCWITGLSCCIMCFNWCSHMWYITMRLSSSNNEIYTKALSLLFEASNLSGPYLFTPMITNGMQLFVSLMTICRSHFSLANTNI